MTPIPDLTADTALSPKQTEVIYALAGGQSLTSAAETAGVHRSTIYEWRAQPAFRSALQSARDARADTIREDTLDMASLATNALRTLLTDPDTPPAVRLKAALSVLQSATTPTCDAPSPRLDPKRCNNDVELDQFFDAIFLAAQREMAASHDRFIQNQTPPPSPPPTPPAPAAAAAVAMPADDFHGVVGRNPPCPSGSGKDVGPDGKCRNSTLSQKVAQSTNSPADEIRRDPTFPERSRTASSS